MMMNKTELEGCFKLLRSYWPGEWDEARYLVWAEAMDDMDFDSARRGLVALGREARYPTVAEFLKAVRGVAGQVVHGEKGTFLPGTGWVKVLESSADRPELEEAEVYDFAQLRRALRDASGE